MSTNQGKDVFLPGEDNDEVIISDAQKSAWVLIDNVSILIGRSKGHVYIEAYRLGKEAGGALDQIEVKS